MVTDAAIQQNWHWARKHSRLENTCNHMIDWDVFEIRIKKTAGNYCVAIYCCMDFLPCSIFHMVTKHFLGQIYFDTCGWVCGLINLRHILNSLVAKENFFAVLLKLISYYFLSCPFLLMNLNFHLGKWQSSEQSDNKKIVPTDLICWWVCFLN